MKFGVHVSIAGKIYQAIDRAAARNCETMQIFSSNPRSWRKRRFNELDIEEFKKRRSKTKIEPLILHTPYLLNLASPEFQRKSVQGLIDALDTAQYLEADYVVTHIGCHRGAGEKSALKQIGQSISLALGEVSSVSMLLLENTAGAGTMLGYTFKHFRLILQYLNWDERLGICFDICHGFAAGYDIVTEKGLQKTLLELDEMVGLERLKALHASDSKGELGTRLDRHEDIGKGHIGLAGFKKFLNQPQLKHLPCILETPKMTLEDDLRNLKTIKKLL